MRKLKGNILLRSTRKYPDLEQTQGLLPAGVRKFTQPNAVRVLLLAEFYTP